MLPSLRDGGDTWPVWLLAARVDMKSDAIVERWHLPSNGRSSASLGEPSAEEEKALLEAMEMLRPQRRLREVILFSDSQIHLYRRSTHSARVGTIVVGKRHRNLERLLAVMRHVSRTVDA